MQPNNNQDGVQRLYTNQMQLN